MSNKVRLPASGLGAERPEQLAHLQARSLYQHRFSLSLPLFLHSLSFFFLSHLSRRGAIHSHPSSVPPILPPRLSLTVIIRNKNSSRTIRPLSSASPHVIYAISSSSASSSTSASTSCASRRCLPPNVASNYDCRLCSGRQHRTHHFWCSAPPLRSVWFAARWTVGQV